MAVRNVCPRCRKVLHAPEDYRGTKVECPRCGYRSILRSEEEVEEEARAQMRDVDRLAFIERLEARENLPSSGGGRRVQRYQPGRPSRFIKLRALSEFMILGGYIVALLCLGGAGLTVYLGVSGAIHGYVLLGVVEVAWGIVGIVGFTTMKFLGELALLLAEMGDQQADLVDLLVDLRRGEEGP